MLPLTSVSPREAYLERRVKELEAENKWLRLKNPPNRYSVLDEPETLEVPLITTSVNLPVIGGADVRSEHDGLHVVLHEVRRGEGFRLAYCISWGEIESARDRAGLLQFLHERALRQIAQTFFV